MQIHSIPAGSNSQIINLSREHLLNAVSPLCRVVCQSIFSILVLWRVRIASGLSQHVLVIKSDCFACVLLGSIQTAVLGLSLRIELGCLLSCL